MTDTVPSHSRDSALDIALQHMRAGENHKAAALLAQILLLDPGNEQAWHMLSFVVQDREKQIYALQRVLDLNAGNRAARSRLRLLSTTDHPMTSAHPRAPVAQGQEGGSAAGVAPVGRSVQPIRATTIETSLVRGHARRTRIRIRLARRRFGENWRVFSESRFGVVGLVLIGIFALMAIAHPILIKTVWPRSIYDPVTGFDTAITPHPSLPSPAHLLGTDTLGRDVLSMLLAATTPTFVVGLTAALMTALVGTVLSMTAAFSRGVVDTLITNLADVFLLFPAPVIMVIIGARFRDLGPIPLGLIYGIVTGAGGTVLVMRAHGLQVVSRPYMEAARIAGGNALHIIVKHLLPAMLPLAALQMMIAVTGAVVADGFISFFGLTRTVSNWGTLIYDAFVYGQIGLASGTAWHMLVPAALCFSLFALGFYLVSRGLHRVASPVIREERR